MGYTLRRFGNIPTLNGMRGPRAQILVPNGFWWDIMEVWSEE